MHAALAVLLLTALNPRPPRITTRREAVLSAAAASSLSTSAVAAPFEWSAIWSSAAPDVVEEKRVGLSPSEVAKELSSALSERRYILTGDMPAAIFSDTCRFQDPNNAVTGLNKYRQALSFLFRPELSSVRDVTTRVVTGDSGATVVEADYVASGTLKAPWRPRIAPWSGHLVYTLDENGLVSSQVDTWNITRMDALRQTFTPGGS